MTFAYQLLQLTQERPAYLEEFEEVLSTIPSSLGLEQEKALTLCLAASPLMVITGVVGSGKTYLVKVLAETLLKADQKFLLLTTSVESVTIYREGLAIFSQIDYLPLGSFPDPLLQKLRSPRKLDKWVNIIERSPETILSTLKEEFPQESLPRLEILAYHLREIAPLLQEQLSLQQVSEGIDKSSSLFTLATIEEFFSLSDNLTKEYKAIIVEDAHTLSLQKISQLARMTDRLILVGDSPLFGSRESDFENLYNRLLPNYRYNLSQQYRLHPFLAEPIFKTLYDDYISSVFQGDRLDLPQLKSRLIWQDVRTDAENDVNPIEGNRLLRFLAQFQNVPAEKKLVFSLLPHLKRHG